MKLTPTIEVIMSSELGNIYSFQSAKERAEQKWLSIVLVPIFYRQKPPYEEIYLNGLKGKARFLLS